MTAPVDPVLDALDTPTPTVLAWVASTAENVHAMLDVCIAHRAKAVAGGFPEQIADMMGYALWQVMMGNRVQDAPS